MPAISAVGHSWLPDWDGEAWTEAKTRNPASIFRRVLMGAGNARPVAESRLLDTRLREWHDVCVEEGWTYDAVLLRARPVEDVLEEVAAAGRARPSWVDGLRSVVIDRAQRARVQVFTPANSRGFVAKRITRPIPHALWCRYRDETQDYGYAITRVYRPGYDSWSARLVDEVKLPGLTRRDHVSETLAYHLRAATARREQYEVSTDWEHLVAQRGARVGLQHDALHERSWSGRVLSTAATDAPHSVDVEVDSRPPLRDGINYWLIHRPPGAAVATYVAAPGPDGSVRVTGTAEPLIGEGDLVAIGQVGTGIADCLVEGIEPDADAGARITLVEYGGATIFQAQPGYTVEHTDAAGEVDEGDFGAREHARAPIYVRTRQRIYHGGVPRPEAPIDEEITPPWTGEIPDDRVVWTCDRRSPSTRRSPIQRPPATRSAAWTCRWDRRSSTAPGPLWSSPRGSAAPRSAWRWPRNRSP